MHRRKWSEKSRWACNMYLSLSYQIGTTSPKSQTNVIENQLNASN